MHIKWRPIHQLYLWTASERASHLTQVALRGTLGFSFGKSFFVQAIWLSAVVSGTISLCLPNKRCDFSNWQSLFRCLATSWQTPVLTVGGHRGKVGGLCCLRGRLLQPISSSLSHCSLSPSMEWQDLSSRISCLGKRQDSMRSWMPTQGHGLCREPTKITSEWRGRDRGWWVPEEGKRSEDDGWRLRCPPCQSCHSMLASQGPATSRLARDSRGSSGCWVSEPSLWETQTEWLHSHGPGADHFCTFLLMFSFNSRPPA